jgi:tetratricopeptide (TPR) repeat protein
MTLSVGLSRGAFFLLASVALLAGCLRSAPTPADEEKESHFLLGRSLVSAMDYEGAMESFEKALEVNPRSGAAHFELGCLLEKRDADPAAAIYHYQQYLKLRPKADNAETVNQHILALKQELARTVSLGPVTERQQREFERLVEDNHRLTEELEKWRAYAMSLQALTNQAATSAPASRVAAAAPPTPRQTGLAPTAAASVASAKAPMVIQQTHTVKTGETAAMIARRYGVRLNALLAANPKLNPRRMRAGQTLNIPATHL